MFRSRPLLFSGRPWLFRRRPPCEARGGGPAARTGPPRWRRLAAGLVGPLLLTACAQQMADAPRYDPFERSAFFADGLSARQPVPDTVARGELVADELLASGRENGVEVDRFPFPVGEETIRRGQDRFEVFCSPCHGRVGYGDGMVVRRGFSPPPSFHTDRLRAAPVGHFVDVMTNGYGAMPSYANQVPPRDRWAIAAYIRALQLSQHASLDDLPADARQQLEQQP